MSNEAKIFDAVLGLTREVSNLSGKLDQHLKSQAERCSDHHSWMEKHDLEIKDLQSFKWKNVGIATLIPLLISILAYIWITHEHSKEGSISISQNTKRP